MSNPSRSLSTSVDWQSLLATITDPPTVACLPAFVSCPICRFGTATIYEDGIVGGQWYHCPACKNNGDMIEFAAKTWKLRIETTIVKLRHNGFHLSADRQDISKYVNQHVDYRNRLLGLWNDAVKGMKQPSSELGRLIHRFNFRSEVPADRWASGPGALLGGIDTASVERVFSPGAMEHADEKGQRSNPSAHAIFRGPGWKDVLVIPFFDLPGRICSFLFVGRDGSYPDDFVLRRANYGHRGNQYCNGPYEAGLAMHPGVLDSADDWERTIVAVADPIVAMQLQMRQFEQSQQPLPMVSWYDSMLRLKQHEGQMRVRTINSWQLLGNRQVVFWMPSFSTSAIHQAIERNALVSTIGPRDKGMQALKDFAAKFTPRDLTRHIIQSARPWPEVLSKVTERTTDSVIERIFRRLHLDGVNVELELEACTAETRQRVRSVLADTSERSGRIGSRTYVERHGKWYLQGRRPGMDELVADAALRIDYVINHRTIGKTYYKGRILYGEKSVPFCELRDTVEDDTLHWMQNLLMERGVGYLIGNPGHSKNLVQVSRLFGNPTIVSANDRIGWDDKGQRFVFPRFAIARDGNSELVSGGVFSGETPARSIEEPSELSPEVIERGTPQFWAAMALFIGNIIAPASSEPTHGIGLDGESAQEMMEAIASALDCRELILSDIREVRRLIDEEHDHGWPVYARRGDSLQQRAWKELLREPSERNLMSPLDWYEARIMALHGEWHVLRGDQKSQRSGDIRALSRQFVPAYLRHFCKGALLRDRWNRPLGSFISELLRDMANFVDACGGNKRAVEAAAEYLWPAMEDGNGQVMAELLVCLLADGELKIVPASSASTRIAVLREQDSGDVYFLAEQALAKALSRHATPPLPNHRVTAALRSASALVQQYEDGWTLSKNWLQRHLRLTAVLNSGLLKVIG